MREIKFMAWHKEKKILREVLEISFSGGYVILAGFGSFGEIEAPIRDVELMQYAGLKDKNGVEIYEGYITKDTYGTQIPMVVTWDDAGFRRFGEHNGERYVGYVKDSCEVIGNIYENPELLGRKNEK